MRKNFKFLLPILAVFFGDVSPLERPETLNQIRSGLQSTHTPPSNQLLAAELLAMQERDQAIRGQIRDFKNISEEERKTLQNIDQNHNHRLKEIISEFGWPGIRLVGIKASFAMWLLVQHQDSDLEFQKQALSLLKDAVQRQDAGHREYAYLFDRVRKNENLPQVYGTQWRQKDGKWGLYTCEEVKTLNQRRQEVGLNPIEDYEEQMKAAYNLTDENFE